MNTGSSSAIDVLPGGASDTTTGNNGGRIISVDTGKRSGGALIAENYKIFPGKKLTIPLGLFFTKHPSSALPLAAIAGCNDIRIAVKFRPLADLIQLHADYPMPQLNAQPYGGQINEDATYIEYLDGSTRVQRPTFPAVTPPAWTSGQYIESGTCKLRCTYVHVTGPEASALMSREQVRLMSLWATNTSIYQLKGNPYGSTELQQQISMDLSFLHPVSELIFIFRKSSDMGSSLDATSKPSHSDQGARNKSYFTFHGKECEKQCGNTYVGDPNLDHVLNRITWGGKSFNRSPQPPPDLGNVNGNGGSLLANDNGTGSGHSSAFVADDWLRFDSVQLTINGQERMPSLAGTGVDAEYIRRRWLPALHTNSSNLHDVIERTSVNFDLPYIGGDITLGTPNFYLPYQTYQGLSVVGGTATNWGPDPTDPFAPGGNDTLAGNNPYATLAANQFYSPKAQADAECAREFQGQRQIFVYPFSLAPESHSPSGAVNFSKVSNSKITFTVTPFSSNQATISYQVDVFAKYYNWLQIKDGRALLSFA